LDGELRRYARLGVAALSLLGAVQPAALAADSKCHLGKMAEFPITMHGMRPLMTAGINGTQVQFMVDSGAFYSTLSPASAAELKLQTRFAPFGFYMQGVGGGRAEASIATVKTFTLAGAPLKNIDFLVGGSDTRNGTVGVLGQNVLHIADVEYDLGEGAVRLMKPIDCGQTVLAYWVKGSTPYSVISIDPGSGLDRHTDGHAYINGVEIRVAFDTGAGSSVLSLRAAARAGIKPDSPGVVPGGMGSGIGKNTFATYIAPFASFKIGDEEIKNTKLRIGDIDLPDADMLLGPDFFLSHRIYVANGQRKLYFTYNGGPVFNLTVKLAAIEGAHSPEPAEPPSKGAQQPEEAVPPTAETAAGSPHDQEAADLSRRGTAAAARGDLGHAIDYLNRACALAPNNPEYLYQRGMAFRENRQVDLAMADFDRAIELRPLDAAMRISRAELLLHRGRKSRAATDLDAANGAASKESDLRYTMARDYEAAGLPDEALGQYDLWTQFHTADVRYPTALMSRCRARALKGVDLPGALKDCTAARGSLQKSNPLIAQISDSRGLVLLRMGEYGRSIADYDASLKINPENPWAWYGRGICELRTHKEAQGQADIARAEELWPQVAEEFKIRGILP
jgi:tetratricopeptide (TPR) repeat protein/predicted aspartyl protease